MESGLLKVILLFVAGCFVWEAIGQDPQLTRIAVIGCHKQKQEAPALDFISEVINPDFAIWVGDNVYADTHDNAEYIHEQLRILEEKPGFQALREKVSFFVTWDDHDYGLNNAGGEYALKRESMLVHRSFWRLEKEIPIDQSGVFYARREILSNGKVIQFILLDGRYNRGNPSDANADALGEEQWEWLEAELMKPADLRMIVSGYQVLLEKPTRWEAWVKVGKSRDRLFHVLRSAGVDNAFFVTGDQHYVEVLKSSAAVPIRTYEFMASGINQTESAGKARNRVAGPDVTKHSAPVIEILWTDDPEIRFLNYHVVDGSVGMFFKINRSDIKWRK